MTDETKSSTAQSNQDARLALIPAVYRTNHERLACELAMKLEKSEEIFARYGYTAEQALELMDSQSFADTLARVGDEIKKNGISFRTKARAIAEDLLPHAYDMATDPYQPAAVRADLIKWTTKVGGLEPKEKDEGKSGGGLTLNISFAGQEPQAVIKREVVTIDQEA